MLWQVKHTTFDQLSLSSHGAIDYRSRLCVHKTHRYLNSPCVLLAAIDRRHHREKHVQAQPQRTLLPAVLRNGALHYASWCPRVFLLDTESGPQRQVV